MTEERDEQAIAAILRFLGETLDWLDQHHAHYGQQTEHDLAEADRVNAIWKLSGESLSHTRALISLLREGYTGQTWPTMSANHESNQLLGRSRISTKPKSWSAGLLISRFSKRRRGPRHNAKPSGSLSK